MDFGVNLIHDKTAIPGGGSALHEFLVGHEIAGAY